jgi:hypothetical protein
MAEYSFPDYSGVFNKSSGYDWASTEGVGGSWAGQYNPETEPIYTPQNKSAGGTNWIEMLQAGGMLLDAAGNAVRAFRGEPRLSGGPFDKFVEATAAKQQEKEDEDVLGKLLEKYTKDSSSEKRLDPLSLLEGNVLDPTKRMNKTGVTDEDKSSSNLSAYRLAGDIFSGRYPNLF